MHWSGYALWVSLVALAHRQTSRRLPDRDPYILPLAALMSGIGLLTIWRLVPYFGQRQTLWLAVAMGTFIFGLRLPSSLSFLQRYKYVWLSSGLALTTLTLVLGTNPLGAGPRMWLGCCGIYFQPSEPLKILLIVYLAAYLADQFHTDGNKTQPQPRFEALIPFLAPTLIMTGLALLLLAVQRDLGTASIFLFLYTVIVYIASKNLRIILAGVVTLILAGIVGYALFDVVRIRVDAWLNPWIDPSNRSFQIVQSLLAVANGGVLGRGPGLGNPGLVPIPHSDFIFASIAEESGLIGTIGLLALIALLTARGMRITLNAVQPFHSYLAAGITAFLVGQSILIIAGNLRLLPLTGVTLPFVAYGGSSLLTSWVCILFLVHISNQEHQEQPYAAHQPQSYLQLAAFLLAGLTAIALALGWWAFYRGPDLLTRTDNPRRAIADRYVQRGAILSRNNEPIVISSGKPGNISRQIIYTPLSPVIGYTDPIYGQSGLEASLDPYLRGTQGNPNLMIWWNHILYGQPPPGLDVRLSLDLPLQGVADQLLSESRGAIVLLNAQSGEILAMASHPTYDANQLQENWADLIIDDRAPLLNRAWLGSYAARALLEDLLPNEILASGIDSVPVLRLPVYDQNSIEDGEINPLQAALVAATLTNLGVRPAPILVQAVNTPMGGWVLLTPLQDEERFLAENTAIATTQSLAVDEANIWEKVVTIQDSEPRVTWYIGGTTTSWHGIPLAVAVLLEGDNPGSVTDMGQEILRAAMEP